MGQEPRKATEVLLELESKLDVLLGTVKTMDLTIKILSNKLNEIMRSQEKQLTAPQKITVEAVQTTVPVPNQSAVLFGQAPNIDPERTVIVTAESKLPADDTPQGFRRTSRPESYVSGDSYLKKEGVPPPRNETIPMGAQNTGNKPPPGRNMGDTLPTQTVQPVKNKMAAKPPVEERVAPELSAHGIVPVEQRVVDRNNKSVFLADVEIIDLDSGEQVSKSRTNGMGKWMAALPVGNYRVIIGKLEPVTKTKVESVQTIKIDGIQSPLKLPMVIIK